MYFCSVSMESLFRKRMVEDLAVYTSAWEEGLRQLVAPSVLVMTSAAAKTAVETLASQFSNLSRMLPPVRQTRPHRVHACALHPVPRISLFVGVCSRGFCCHYALMCFPGRFVWTDWWEQRERRLAVEQAAGAASHGC